MTPSAAALDGYVAMGGYAGFIWPAFAITLAVLAVLAVQSARTLRRHRRTLAALIDAAGSGNGSGDA